MKITFPQASRNRTGLAAVIASTAVAALGLTACGGSGTSQAELALIRQQTAAHVHKEERLRRLERDLHRVQRGQTRTPHSYPRSYVGPEHGSDRPGYASESPGSPCGGGIAVNSVTTCPFAANVASAYFEEIGSGSGSVVAYSPRTGETYVMHCTGYPHECTGGNNAAVYFQ